MRGTKALSKLYDCRRTWGGHVQRMQAADTFATHCVSNLVTVVNVGPAIAGKFLGPLGCCYGVLRRTTTCCDELRRTTMY